MSISRVHLGWSRPVLVSAADWFVEHRAHTREVDLSDLLVVVPGARAGRRLLEILVHRCDTDDRVLVPPNIVTLGALGDLLIDPARPAADAVTAAHCWQHVLRTHPATRTVITHAPDADDVLGWSSLADVVARLHDELGGHGLSFADTLSRARSLAEFADEERWAALEGLERAFVAALDALGLDAPHEQRQQAVRAGRVRTTRPIVLVAVADMLPLLRGLLVATDTDVTALIAAPASLAARFDEIGCLRPASWVGVPIEIDDAQIHIADRPADQGARTCATIEEWAADVPNTEVVVGVPASEIADAVAHALRTRGLAPHAAAGTPIERTAPYRVLDGVARLLRHRHFVDLAALLRHPQVDRWLVRRDATLAAFDTPTALDRYATRHLPDALPDPWLGREGEAVAPAARAFMVLLAPLESDTKPLAAWSEAILALLAELFDDDVANAPESADTAALVAACEAIRDVVVAQNEAHDPAPTPMSAWTAIELTLRRVAGASVPQNPVDDAVELLGWLELALDDTRCAVITGVNEGIIPSSLSADAFLPNALRRHLGILDNERRFARDAYALEVVLHTRERVAIIAGRSDADGNPLPPSRLILATDAGAIARRVTRYYGDTQQDDRSRESSDAPRTTSLPIPRPVSIEPPMSWMGVTWFRDYLACPYRFYLRRILGLRPSRDDANELDHAAFGTLAHTVLDAFGRSASCASDDARAIRGALDQLLRAEVDAMFGAAPKPAVLVQVEQLRERFNAFADWQAAWAGDGWRIVDVEVDIDAPESALVVAGGTMRLRGRADRIDVNARTGEWAVLDYKTSDRAQEPDAAHRSKEGRWIDLQLPLYAYALMRSPRTANHAAGALRLGYVMLPSEAAACGVRFAAWTDADLADALDCARGVAEAVRAQHFWPPADPAPPFSEDFAAICQDGQRRPLDDDDGAA